MHLDDVINPGTPEMAAKNLAGIKDWKDEAQWSFTEFVHILGMDRDEIIKNPTDTLEYVEAATKSVDLYELNSEDLRTFRIEMLFYIGEYLRHAHKGTWEVDQDSDSPSYAHYVVKTADHVFAPVFILDAYSHDPPGRDLKKYLVKPR